MSNRISTDADIAILIVKDWIKCDCEIPKLEPLMSSMENAYKRGDISIVAYNHCLQMIVRALADKCK